MGREGDVMDAAMARVMRLAALRQHAAEEINEARKGDEPDEHLAEARAAYQRILQLEETRRS